jgi:hypothetical protein
MKKVSLLILLVIVLSTVLMAATPTKMMRLTIINKSGSDLYIQLEGSEVTGAFYYLTIPAGDRDEPMVKVFTVMSDAYKRTTWQCEGVKSTGSLVMDTNIRLTFLPCGTGVCSYVVGIVGYYGGCNRDILFLKFQVRRPTQGEPTMEKVSYYKYLSTGTPSWGAAQNYNGFWNFGCFTWYWRIRTYKLPVGCSYRYQY